MPKIHIPALFLALCLYPAYQAVAAENTVNRQELRSLLRELLKEDPGLVLDVLRDHSEFVLDVAQQGADLRREKMLQAQWRQDLTKPKKIMLESRPTLGPAEAPVTIAVFTDFTCVYCQQAEQTIKRLLQVYDGKIRVVYKYMPMRSHPGALEAAELMLAAYRTDKRKSWEVFDTFFANRTKILSNEGQTFMRAIIAEKGLDLKKLLAEAQGGSVQGVLAEDESDAKTLQFDGTPSFLVNNLVIRGALQENFFRQAVDLALAEATKK
ncbi:MAG: thioredoxin domain-containing protein [Desulfovibrionaceae bacterium]|nr:thioredoxin domain-containing protein [Desulfovibrionaceae bacterium]